MPSHADSGALAVLCMRVAYGAGLLAAPEKLTRTWLGEVRHEDGTQVALRSLGAREMIIHGAALCSALRGGPVRPYLYASAAGDLCDVVATVLGRKGLPSASAPATALVAGGSALLSALVAAAVDR